MRGNAGNAPPPGVQVGFRGFGDNGDQTMDPPTTKRFKSKGHKKRGGAVPSGEKKQSPDGAIEIPDSPSPGRQVSNWQPIRPNARETVRRKCMAGCLLDDSSGTVWPARMKTPFVNANSKARTHRTGMESSTSFWVQTRNNWLVGVADRVAGVSR